MNNWYAIYTTPRAEKRVKERLDVAGYKSYLPLHRTPHTWSNMVKMVDVPLFNSYIFVCCRESDIYDLVHIKGVVKIIYSNGKPAVIRQCEIDAIGQFLQQAEGRKLCTGDEVKILTGAMKHVSGKIMCIKKKYITLYIECMGVTVCVSVGNVALTGRL